MTIGTGGAAKARAESRDVAAAAVRLSITLPWEEEHARGELERLTRESLSSLIASTGVPAPDRVHLRVHPTVESYQRATRRPWWTAGSTQANAIHLVPVAALMANNRLAAVLRHELAHVLVDSELGDRPLWTREGAAMHFAGEVSHAVPVAGRCPEDREIMDAPDLETLRRVYREASSCFERALAAGASWRTVPAHWPAH
jgi:hypothetical protein